MKLTKLLSLFITFIAVFININTYAQYNTGFEGSDETKTSYASGDVILSGIQWNMTEALIGTLSNDKKIGSRSMRMRRNGTIPGTATMLNDKPDGIGTISFKYARFGTETGQPTLFVEYSIDGGISWTQAGSSITSFPNSLTNWSATINQGGNVRIRFRTNTGGTSQRRFNIDDIQLTNYIPACYQPTAFGTASAPTTPTPLTISTCTYAGEYNTINSIVSGQTYQFESSIGSDWLVLTDASNNLITSGTSPINWTANFSGTVRLHISTNSNCGTQNICRTTKVTCLSCIPPPCIQPTPFISINAPTTQSQLTISTCTYAGEYNTINSVVSGSTYLFESSINTDWLVLTDAQNNLLASGTSSINWTATFSGTVRLHVSVDNNCGIQNVCRTTSVICTSCIPVPCTQPTPYVSINAPTIPTPQIITNCTYAGEYNTINSVVSGSTYQFESSVGTDWLVLTDASNNVIVSGSSPINWTANFNGTVRLHVSTNSNCGTQNVCRTTTITCNSCQFPPIISSFTPTNTCFNSNEQIIITGQNFTNVISVSLGNNNVQSFVVNSSTQITISIGSSMSGFITVVTPGGSTTSSSIFTVNASPSQSVSVINVGCFGDSSGNINLTPSGGSAPYSFSWNNGVTTEDLTNVPAGIYSVIITDQNNCTTSTSVTITQPTSTLNDSIVKTNVLIYGNSTGAIDLTMSGGTAPYTYLWSNGATTEDLTGLAAGTYTVTVTDANGCQLITSVIIEEPIDCTIGDIEGAQILCGYSQVSYTIEIPSCVVNYYWNMPQGMTIIDEDTDVAGYITVDVSIDELDFVSGDIIFTAVYSGGTSSDTLAVSQIPFTPEFITTATCGIPNTTVTFEVEEIEGVESYVWTQPNLSSLLFGQNTDSVRVKFGSLFNSGTLSVVATNLCGSSPAAEFFILAPPATANNIQGPTTICSVEPSQLYYVDSVANASYYIWGMPNGATIISNPATNDSVNVMFQNFSSGVISVKSANTCGSSSMKYLTVTAPSIAAPTGISGPQSVCSYVGTGQIVNYTTPMVSGVTNYIWSMPSGATISNGLGTNTIGVQFAAGFTGGNIGVSLSNGCSLSQQSTLQLLGVSAGGAPQYIDLNGQSSVCSFIGTGSTVYSVTPPIGANSYVWSVPNDATIISGSGTSSITVSFASSFVTGTISVTVITNCGTTYQQSKTVTKIPSDAGAITGPNCILLGSTYTYSIAAVSGATSYHWTVPSNATITSGQWTSSITVQYSNSFSGGDMTVTPINSCGNGTSSTITIGLAIVVPSQIFGATSVCLGQTLTYYVTPVPTATYYIWAVPVGMAIIGYQYGDSIVVSVDNQFISGLISCKSVNDCGSSPMRYSNTISTGNCSTAISTSPQVITKISINENNEVGLYPNPTNDKTFIKLINNEEKLIKIIIYDNSGRCIFNQVIDIDGDSNFIDLSMYNSGVYLVFIITSNSKDIYRVIKI
jgi:hypothetical protein